MASLQNSSIATATPNRRRPRSLSTKESIIVNTTLIQDYTNALRSSAYKKQRINYNTLYNHSFQANAPPSLTANPTVKRARIQAQKAFKPLNKAYLQYLIKRKRLIKKSLRSLGRASKLNNKNTIL
jgi:hypothetical protein